MTMAADAAAAVAGYVATFPPRAAATVLAMLVLQRLVRRLGLAAYAAFALPGTLAHELAHYLVAWMLGARPRLPDLRPQRTATGWRLGAVAFAASWWRAGPIALAPLAPLSLEWTRRAVAPAHGAAFVAHAWVAATLLAAALPSRADLRIAAPFLLAVAAAGAAAAAFALLR